MVTTIVSSMVNASGSTANPEWFGFSAMLVLILLLAARELAVGSQGETEGSTAVSVLNSIGSRAGTIVIIPLLCVLGMVVVVKALEVLHYL